MSLDAGQLFEPNRFRRLSNLLASTITTNDTKAKSSRTIKAK